MVQMDVILTGFMGVGKSTVGRLLAERLNRPFIDTDAAIEAADGRTIAEIFEQDGEPAFREREIALARSLVGAGGRVIATGGGFFVNRDVQGLFAEQAVVCLTAEPETIFRRLQGYADRPLLQVSNPAREIERLLAQRAGVYSAFPQVRTDGRSPEAIVETIVRLLHHRYGIHSPVQLTVTHPTGSYPIWVDHDLLPELIDRVEPPGGCFVVTDANVGPHFADRVDGATVLTVPAGEAHKTLSTATELYAQLVEAGADRQSTIIALGGGMVGDLAGFVAATYMRGVDFVQAPTSLLAMVDASIGGKTGVDLPHGKNLVGAFKQPRAVVADLSTLGTLPSAEFAAGMAEVIKHGLIADPGLFAAIEAPGWSADSLSPAALRDLVLRAIAVKRDAVEADPFERTGRRALLNLGHTFGHALEHVSGYALRHGEAVGLGLLIAARVSVSLGYCQAQLVRRIETALRRAQLPLATPSLDVDALVQALGSDKKKRAGRVQFILLRDVGAPFITGDVPLNLVRDAFVAAMG